MQRLLLTTACWLGLALAASAGPYSPPAGQPGSTAISMNSPTIVFWASGVANLSLGPQDIAVIGSPLASSGTTSDALGPADGNPLHALSLGDGGSITLTFPKAITNGPGPDFAVFENSFNATFLELAFVEVSSNGVDFERFRAASLTQTTVQVGTFDSLDATDLNNLAGNFAGGFGTPFDLAEIIGKNALVNPANINYVRIVDVVGRIAGAGATHDFAGNVVNDPYPTAFPSSGFDLDGVAAINVVPEPASFVQAALAALLLSWSAFKRRAAAGNVTSTAQGSRQPRSSEAVREQVYVAGH